MPSSVSDWVHDDMRARDYSIVTCAGLGFPDICQAIVDHLYRPEVLIPQGDQLGPVRDRYRAKDFCIYRWSDDVVSLERVQDDRLARLGTRPSYRVAPRTDFLSVPYGGEFVATLLGLVPKERRREQGTWGVHTFRSFTNVVDSPHQDGFEYGVTLVLAREGEGGVSYLLKGGEYVLEHQLQPGEMLFYKDSEFMHGATPLVGDCGDRTFRDALVIQFDAPEDLEAAREGGLL